MEICPFLCVTMRKSNQLWFNRFSIVNSHFTGIAGGGARTLPDQAHNVDGWIKFLKDGAIPPPPLRIEIVNASELQKDTVVTLRRDESGKLTAATAVKV
jgi:hypothetical protein